MICREPKPPRGTGLHKSYLYDDPTTLTHHTSPFYIFANDGTCVMYKGILPRFQEPLQLETIGWAGRYFEVI